MKNYILLRRGIQEHYFINSAGGICCHSQKNGFWTSPQCICATAAADFGLYKDERENIHIVCADRSGSLIYTLIHGEKISQHTILTSKANVSVSDFFIKSHNGFLNLFYIASTGGTPMLIHCLLGNNSQPSVVSELSVGDFFVHENRVYYSNSVGILGYSDFSDAKPSVFVPLFENSKFPYIVGSGADKHSTWICGGSIMLDGAVLTEDSKAEHPIIVGSDTLMWQSDGIVHYVTIGENGKASAPMRFISSGKIPELFCVQNYDEFRYYYGTHSSNEVNLFGKCDIFEHRPTSTPPQGNTDIQRLKIIVDMVQKEMASIKQQLKLIKQLTEQK